MKNFLLLFFSIGSLFFPRPAQAEGTARIAAWNVASGRSSTGGTPIREDRIQRLGEIIATKIKPDVLVLEEVWPEKAAEEIAAASTKAGLKLVAVKLPAQDPKVVQLVSILKRPEVEVTQTELIAHSNDLVDRYDPDEKTTRKAVLAKVKIDHFDFYLVGVHLKSKRASKTVTESPLEMRDRQCKTISDRIHEFTAAGKEKDVILIGDYNMTPEGEEELGELSDAKNFETLDSHDELRFLSSEVKGATHVGFFGGHFHRSKLDGLAIAHATEPEYVAGSYRVLNDKVLEADGKQFTNQRSENFLSDHFPIVAEFKTTEDDD